MNLTLDAARILDFDIEARPLSWIGGDYVSREITSIACSFSLDTPVYCWLLGIDDPATMLAEFRTLYDMADVVTGHYIRKYDLPNINGALLEYGMSPLSPKLVSDTKIDLAKIDGVSKSQESIADMLSTEHHKQYMSQKAWRTANRLEQVELTEARVTADVRQHQEMRVKLVDLGMLGAPRMWYPQVRY